MCENRSINKDKVEDIVDKNYFKKAIQHVLNISHKDTNKRNITEYPDRFQFACPYCGDSDKSVNKKRGNFYFENLFYVCFNCEKKASFNAFTKEYDIAIDPSTKVKIYDYLDSHIDYNNYEETFLESKFDSLIDIKELESYFNSEDNFSPIFDFKPIVKDSKQYRYLYDRNIKGKMTKYIYQAKFDKGPNWAEDIIVILNANENQVLGMQVRNLKSESYKRMFKIYNFEQLVKWLDREDEMDMKELVMYNKLSYFFNILNVDLYNRVTVFEGYLDSLFYPNSIGVVGVNTDLGFLEHNNLDIQYFFDNDIAGFNKSNDKIKSGFDVFLWKKMFESIVDTKNPFDPYTLYNRISKIKDLNKLATIVNNPYKELDLKSFFSKDIYDIKYIPKKKWKFNKK